MSHELQTAMFPQRFAVRPITMELTLVAVAGPTPVTLILDPQKQYTIGRRANHGLPLEHPEVSKDHATLTYRADQGRGGWHITDTASRHGTRVNGVALEPDRSCPIVPGDLIEIAPWTFCMMSRSERVDRASRVSTIDDTLAAGSTVTSIQADAGRELAQERLRLLLHCAESLQRVPDEKAMAETVLNAAVAGTGFANAAILRPMTPDGAIEMIVSRGEISAAGAMPRLSRSLIRSASQGVPVQLRGSPSPVREAFSIAEFDIQEAICVPLMVESTVAGFLYLDSRGRLDPGKVAAQEASAFAVGIGRLASMAWANLMRLELERRYARMEGELSAGARAQQLILPRREGKCGGICYIGECKPGRVISGDFFDVFSLPDGRAVVTVGDVSGKGIAASVIMTTTQGFLHGALRQHGDLARAMNDLNEFVHARCESQIFVTLWAGIFDAAGGTLTYADAGHGYAWKVNPNGTLTQLDAAGGPPIAVAADSKFETATVHLEPGCRALMVSDGISEQPARSKGKEHGEQFGRQRVQACMQSLRAGADEVANLFEAVQTHAGTTELADDATVVVVRW